MKYKYLIFLLTVLILVSFSCSDDNDFELINISGITELDYAGNKIGNIDETDWNYTDSWKDIEENLFKANNPAHNVPTEKIAPDQSVYVGGYPNPAKEDLISLAFQLNDNMYYDMRIVDRNLNIIVQRDSMKSGNLVLNGSKFINNLLYRLYYKIYDEDKVYRGHGDFKFIK